MQRGFIQIPILIAIIVGIATLGGTGYFAYEVGKTSQNPSPKESTKETQVTTTANVTVATSTEIAEKNTDNKDLIIGSLQKQVSDLTKKASSPKIETPKITPTTETPKTVITPTVSASTNPAAKCLDPKKKWDDFVKSINEINIKYLSLQSSYSQGTANTPEETVAYFSYKYSLALSAKAKFLSDAGNIRKILETIPSPPLPGTISPTTYSSVTQMKTNYLNSLDYMESAYDIKLSGFKIIAEDENGISRSDIQSATALLDDSFKKYESSVNEFTKNKTAMIFLKSGMNTEHSPSGCYFTFGTDNLVRTTIKEEQDFSQAQPSVSANRNYTEATVALSTNLPIEITEDGKTRTIMQLKCAEKIIGVQRTNQASVYTEVSKTVITGNKCAFTYSGNGNTISSLTATLPW